jgi:uncharacterized protein (DUF3820 family)
MKFNPYKNDVEPYNDDTVMPFGAFQGYPLGQIKAKYLIDLLPNLKDRPDKRLENYIRKTYPNTEDND